MENAFDQLVKQNLYDARKLYHGTITEDAESIEEDGIDLEKCRQNTDFHSDRGFYLTADIHQAMKWAKQIAKKNKGDPAVVRFKIDRQDLEELFDYKRFDVGDYHHWYNFTGLSRSGYDHHRFDIVEGPYRAKNRKGAFTKPMGHQLGLFTERVVEYFDDHIISMSCQLPKLLEGLSLN